MSRVHAATLVVATALLAGCGDDGTNPGPPAGGIYWERTFGGVGDDAGTAVALTYDGGSIVATHQTISAFNRDLYIYRLDPGGAVLWEKRWGGDSIDEVYAIGAGPGVVYIGGRTQRDLRTESSDALLLALGVDDGRLLWEYTFDGDDGYEEVDGIAVTYDAIYLSGWTMVSGSMDILLLQVLPSGTDGWARHHGTAGWDEANGPLLAGAGALFLTGRWGAASQGSGGDLFIGAFDQADGAMVWGHTDGSGSTAEVGLGLAANADRLYVAGFGDSPRGGQVRLWSFFVDGAFDWRATWDGPALDVARAIAVDPLDGTLIVAGSTSSLGAGREDLLLLRFDHLGAPLDTLTWGGGGTDRAHNLALDGARLMVAGETTSMGAGGADAVVLAVDPHVGW